MSLPLPTLFVVVPVFNEAGNLERLFSSFRSLIQQYLNRYQVKIVFIDDGSTDGTPALAEKLSVGIDFVMLVHEINRGPGKAFATAFKYLASCLEDEVWVVTLEGDNTSRSELISQMFQRSSEGFEVILASPYMYGGEIVNTGSFRIILSNIANTFVKEFLEIHGIHTVSSFFRLYRASALRKLQQYYGNQIVERTGFECMVEMLMKMTYLHHSISEVPMVLDTKQRIGKSKMKIFKTVRGYFWLWMLKKHWKQQLVMSVSSQLVS